MAALTPGTTLQRGADLPQVLNADDIARYARIFALQQEGAWSEADREIARLSDRLLLGHVLAQRYLSRSYRTSYDELARWLQRYADEPDAKAIYGLALNRKPHGLRGPQRPEAAAAVAGDSDTTAPAATPEAALVARQIRDLAAAAPRRAELLLAGPEAKRLLGSGERDELRIVIAQSYLASGQAQEALAISAAPHDAAHAAAADWDAGLAAWRLGRMSEAGGHFETLARTPGITAWTKSAAAFWAARVAQRAHRADHVAYWLGIAGEAPRTFYGLIARRLLGRDAELDFEAEPFTTLDARVVGSLDAGRRALALIEVGQRLRAAAELRALAQSNGPALLQSLAGLADRANLAALSLQFAGTLAATDGRAHDGALYPVPRWTPRGGFSVDRALLFALMRQESLFVPKTQSSAGAQGLMQLMPATARALAESQGVALSQRGREAEERRTLADPEINLTLAQEYVRELLGDERIKGSLLLFAVAYNRGPTAAQRWQELAAADRDDPLLFLESVPSPECRGFAKHVLANYWIYRLRLGQGTPDLDALAGNAWPTYIALDRASAGDRSHAANR